MEARKFWSKVTLVAVGIGWLSLAQLPAPALSDQAASTDLSLIHRMRLVTEDLEQSKAFWVEGFGYRVLFTDPAFRGSEMAVGYGLRPESRVGFTILAPPNEPAGVYIDLLNVLGESVERLERPDAPTVRMGDTGLVVRSSDIPAVVSRLKALGADIRVEFAEFPEAPVERGSIGAVSAPNYEAVVVSPEGMRILLVQTLDGPEGNCYLECR